MAPPPRILVPVCLMCPCHIPCVPCPLSLLPLHPVSGLYGVPLPPFLCPLSPVIPCPPQSSAPCWFFSFVSPVPLDNMPPPPVTPVFPFSPCVHCPQLCPCPPMSAVPPHSCMSPPVSLSSLCSICSCSPSVPFRLFRFYHIYVSIFLSRSIHLSNLS